MLLPSNQPIRNIASLTHFLSWSFPVIIQRYVLPCACKTIFCKVKGNSCIRNNTHWLKMNKKEESEKKNMKNTSGMNLLMLFIVLTAFVVLSKLQRKLISYCHVINNWNIIIIQNLLSFCTMFTSMINRTPFLNVKKSWMFIFLPHMLTYFNKMCHTTSLYTFDFVSSHLCELLHSSLHHHRCCLTQYLQHLFYK